MLQQFLDQGFPVDSSGIGDLDDAFEKYADEIKNSSEFNEAAQDYFGNQAAALLAKSGPGTYSLPDTDPMKAQAFSTEYFDLTDYLTLGQFASDLGDALGGAHFGYSNTQITVDELGNWAVSGTMIQSDLYTFPPGPANIRLAFPSYNAANGLENSGYHAFWHTETFVDTIQGSLP